MKNLMHRAEQPESVVPPGDFPEGVEPVGLGREGTEQRRADGQRARDPFEEPWLLSHRHSIGCGVTAALW